MLRNMTALLFLLLVFVPVGFAQEEEGAPEFLLADFDLRIDLPPTWKMTRWSDWDFKGEIKRDASIKLFAWATPVQMAVVEGDLEAWSKIHLDKVVTDFAGQDSKVVKSAVVGDAARYEIEFAFENGKQATMAAASFPIYGRMFHMVTVAAKTRSAEAVKTLDDLVARLEVNKKADEFEQEIKLENKGAETTLPEGWRPALNPEKEVAYKQASDLGVKLKDCWMAIRPRPAVAPDVMVTCQGGMWLGIVDTHSFKARDKKLRPFLFGDVEMEPAEMVELEDRVAFLYHPPLHESTLYLGVVPYDQGLSRIWVMGTNSDDAILRGAIESAMNTTTYTGPHPASLGNYATYWLGDRILSPCVLIPVIFVVLFFFLILAIAILRSMGGSKGYEAIADGKD